ncbi:hypothetical protein CK203_036072 [Vitis vinifera]|uniref:Uncharacterized protein n=1 Tax=Vitis vinifera TaxID=29760 RepID=A0A438HQV9_VITVI|nr:hypothetical protein CK203_036072 [Vitis vinifera]
MSYMFPIVSKFVIIPQITKDLNCSVIFTSSKCVFQDCFTGKMIGHASEKEGLHFLEAKSDKYDSIPLSYMSEEHTTNKTQVWSKPKQRRLGFIEMGTDTGPETVGGLVRTGLMR